MNTTRRLNTTANNAKKRRQEFFRSHVNNLEKKTKLKQNIYNSAKLLSNNANNQVNAYSSINGEKKVYNNRSTLKRIFSRPQKLYKNSSFSRNARRAANNRKTKSNNLRKVKNMKAREFLYAEGNERQAKYAAKRSDNSNDPWARAYAAEKMQLGNAKATNSVKNTEVRDPSIVSNAAFL